MTRSETLKKFRSFAEAYGAHARQADSRENYQFYNGQHLAWSKAADLLEQMED